MGLYVSLSKDQTAALEKLAAAQKMQPKHLASKILHEALMPHVVQKTPQQRPPCLVPKCGRISMSRGLCFPHYQGVRYWVFRNVLSWDWLEAHGRCTPAWGKQSQVTVESVVGQEPKKKPKHYNPINNLFARFLFELDDDVALGRRGYGKGRAGGSFLERVLVATASEPVHEHEAPVTS
jgi:hypothetical protein